MDARMISRLESNIERGAGAVFGVAVGYSAYALLEGRWLALACAAGAGLVAYLLCAAALRVVARRTVKLNIPVFDLRGFEPFEAAELLLTKRFEGELLLTDALRADELLLTETHRIGTHSPEESEPLVLDDVLEAVSADSRVVRLFDRRQIPTPGQLSATINRHLETETRVVHSDAAQALSDALAELRRSLR